MTDILSPSPYAYLDDLSPAERQAEIARRQHQRREDWCDDARRARDYQAEYASLRQDYIDAMDMAENQAKTIRDYQTRVAELEAALEPFNCESDEYQPSWLQHDGWREDVNFSNARAALRK